MHCVEIYIAWWKQLPNGFIKRDLSSKEMHTE